MKTIKIAGRELPAIGIGTWHMGSDPGKRDQEVQAIRTGIEAGAQVIDTAEMYGSGDSERLVKEAIKPYDREKLFLIDKVLPQNAYRQRMEASLDASLEKTGADYFDLYLYHWRGNTPLAETVSELARLKLTGKIKHWGVSNFDFEDLQELWQLPNGQDCAANEDLYNMADRGIEFDVIPWQKRVGMPLIAYSPIAQGDTLGQNLTENPVVKLIAKAHKVTAFQVMLAWVIRHSGVLAISQTGNPAHARENMAAGDLEFTDQELRLLEDEFPKPIHKQPLQMI